MHDGDNLVEHRRQNLDMHIIFFREKLPIIPFAKLELVSNYRCKMIFYLVATCSGIFIDIEFF